MGDRRMVASTVASHLRAVSGSCRARQRGGCAHLERGGSRAPTSPAAGCGFHTTPAC